MEASRAQAKAYLLMGGRFAGATATATASVLVLMVAKSVGGGVDLPRSQACFCQFGTSFVLCTGRTCPGVPAGLWRFSPRLLVYQQRMPESPCPSHSTPHSS